MASPVIARIESPGATNSAAAWTAKDLLDTDTLSLAEIELLLEQARAMKDVRARQGKLATLRGVTVVTLFYEQSTRTRASFEVAGKLLGADVVNLTASGSSVEKGESLVDTVRTLEAIGADLLIIRHPSSGAPYVAARHTRAGVINAGDGTHAHPTQALLDLFTMRDHLGELEGRKVAIVGDVLHSRVARSNLWCLLAMGCNVVLCGPPTLIPRTLSAVTESGSCTVTDNIAEALRDADIVMALRMQNERQEGGLVPSIRSYIRDYQIDSKRIAMASPDVLVMHPGPMNEGVEIAPDVAHGLGSAIEEQVANGVAMRMAILYHMALARS
jgi:aspartate carbamoyltransferase catalytic subunit